MTTEEHLNLIKTKCERMVRIAEIEPQSFMESAVAGWRATLAAVEALESMAAIPIDISILQLTKDILAAWPIELLKP
jgi:hypothetical protein